MYNSRRFLSAGKAELYRNFSIIKVLFNYAKWLASSIEWRVGQQPRRGRSLLTLILSILYLSFAGCSRLVDVTPPVTSVNGPIVFSSDGTAISVLTGLYTKISGTDYNAEQFPNIAKFGGLASDELTLWNGVNSFTLKAYYTNSLYTDPNPANQAGTVFWSDLYAYIYVCNSTIEQLESSTALTPAVRQQLMGEAKFMRALMYFYLTNLYGDLPLVLSTDYRENSKLKRSEKKVVYRQIVSDLDDAKDLLSDQFLDISLMKETQERVRPTRWAAMALLSRAYLYIDDWKNAEMQASAVIDNNLFDIVDLDEVFKKNSKEAIWQLQPVTIGSVTNTQDGKLFILPPSGPNGANSVYLNSELIKKFEVGDQRREKWIDSIIIGGETFYYPYKYKINEPNSPVTEYLMMLRLSEQYLIRAEARAQQGNIVGAKSDINVVRKRGGISNTLASDRASLLTAISNERQIELFSELGHRWLDLKRTGKVDEVMSVVTPKKGGKWEMSDQLFPLPITDVLKAPGLTQNPGY